MDNSKQKPSISRRGLLRGSAVAATGLIGTAAITYGASATDAPKRGAGHTKTPIYPHSRGLHIGADRAEPLGPNEKAFDNIDGVPTMYIRNGSREPATFYCTFNFYDNGLVPWVKRMRDLAKAAGYPELEFITSAGAYVNKPGEHGKGQAIDIDEVGWVGGPMTRPFVKDWDSGDQAVRKRYYALDCTTRAHMRWSLDWAYNTAHHDHIHSDFGGLPVIFGTGSSTDVGFMQALCNEFLGSGLAVDKTWGPLTEAAFNEAKQKLGVSGDPMGDGDAYRAFLDAAAAKGFKGEPF